MPLFDAKNPVESGLSYLFDNKGSSDSTKIAFIQKPLEWSKNEIEEVCMSVLILYIIYIQFTTRTFSCSHFSV